MQLYPFKYAFSASLQTTHHHIRSVVRSVFYDCDSCTLTILLFPLTLASFFGISLSLTDSLTSPRHHPRQCSCLHSFTLDSHNHSHSRSISLHLSRPVTINIPFTSRFAFSAGEAMGSMVHKRPFNQTGVRPQILQDIGNALTYVPETVEVHKDVMKIIDARRQIMRSGKGEQALLSISSNLISLPLHKVLALPLPSSSEVRTILASLFTTLHQHLTLNTPKHT
jgi:hypothetical protein